MIFVIYLVIYVIYLIFNIHLLFSQFDDFLIVSLMIFFQLSAQSPHLIFCVSQSNQI